MILLTCPQVMLKVSARLDLETADLPSSCRAPSLGREHPAIYIKGSWQIWKFRRNKYKILLIYFNIHLNWREACKINASLERFRHCKTRLRIICRAVPRDGVVGWTVTEEGTEPTCDQEHSTLEGNLLGNLKNGSQQSLGDAAALPGFAKRRFHTPQAISP